jgi:uncharacterized membrane protein
MHIGLLAIAVPVSFPGGQAGISLVLRWIHFIAGITWVGLLYFFTLISMRSMRDFDAATRNKVMTVLMPRALWWFRWASVVTVLVGIWMWMYIVGNNVRAAQMYDIARVSGGRAIGSFFGIWTVAFIVYMGVLMQPAEALKKGPVFSAITAVIVGLASWGYLAVNSQGWEDTHLLAIGIGGGLGWFMMFNVWGIIWRVQKKMIRWSAQNAASGAPFPPESAKLARLGYLASWTNFVLSFPMLFFMAAAAHSGMFGR